MIHHLVNRCRTSTHHGKGHKNKRQQNKKPRNGSISILTKGGQNVSPEKDKDKLESQRDKRNIGKQGKNDPQSGECEINLCGGAQFGKLFRVFHGFYYFRARFFIFAMDNGLAHKIIQVYEEDG